MKVICTKCGHFTCRLEIRGDDDRFDRNDLYLQLNEMHCPLYFPTNSYVKLLRGKGIHIPEWREGK